MPQELFIVQHQQPDDSFLYVIEAGEGFLEITFSDNKHKALKFTSDEINALLKQADDGEAYLVTKIVK